MATVNLYAIARQEQAKAATASSGRSPTTVHGGQENVLRQTVVALNLGVELTEHENPGDATVLVLFGRVELHGRVKEWVGAAGDLLVIPDERHSLRAIEDSVVWLTVAMS